MVTAEEAGMNLAAWLRARGLSSRGLRDDLATGKLSVDGVITSDAGRALPAGARVRLDPHAPRSGLRGKSLVLVYVDDDIVVVDKPSGLLSVPARNQRGPNAVGETARLLRERDAHDPARRGTTNEVMVVHRIDQETSGLLVFARHARAEAVLDAAWERHEIDRAYDVFVAGHLPEGKQTLRNFLIRDRGDGRRGALDTPAFGAKEAITEITPIAWHRGMTWLRAQLHTGRTHQVRLQLEHLGHPVLGDPLYGRPQTAPRLALHASVLGFNHPRHGGRVQFESALHDDLVAWWRASDRASTRPAVTGDRPPRARPGRR